MESEIDTELMDMHESNILRSMNDDETIINAYNLTGEEIKRRRNNQFNGDDLLLGNAIASDMNREKDVNLRCIFYVFFVYFFIFSPLCY